jgi:hypothetical protein
MTTSVNYHGLASDCYPRNTSNVGGSLPSCRADADGVGFASNTWVADIDIPIARCQISTGVDAYCNIVVATYVATERKITLGCISIASCVVQKRPGSNGCVIIGRRIAK